MGIEMKIIFLQNLTGGLFGGILKGLLKSRLNGLFTRTPTVAVLLLTAVIAACASSSDSNSSGPTTTTPPTPTPADCTFDEDVGTKDCGSITLAPVDSMTTYNITVGEVGEETTDKIRLSNFTFTQIINDSVSDTASIIPDTANIYSGRLILSANVTALNVTIINIAPNVFGNFYLDLVLVNNTGAAIAAKVRYTISITSVNDAPVFVRGNSPGVRFDSANDARNASYGFADIQFNSTAGYSVGNVSVTDIDNDTITYRIIGGTDDAALFKIDPTTGEITLRAVAENEGDSPIPYAFNVTASDRNDGSTTAVISVSVLPDNQAPVFRAVEGSESQFTDVDGTTPANYNFAGIPINSPMDYSVGNVSADGAVDYEVIGGGSDASQDGTLFQINSETGEITLKAIAAVLGEYTFSVNATDDQDEQTTATITVSVIDITPPAFDPTSYSFDLSLSEGNEAGVVVGNVSVMEPEGTPFTYSLEGSDDLFDDLFGVAPTDNADGNRGIILRRAATLSDFAAPSITFQVVATHQSGGLASEATITVNLINDLPLDDDLDGDEVKGFYDAFPHDATMNVMGDGEPGNPFIISNIYQLQAVAGVDHAGTALDSSDFTGDSFLYGDDAADQLTKHYELANNINASDTADTTVWTKPPVTGYRGNGWTPIAGNSGQSFSGSFSGEGYAINSLEIIARQGDNSRHFGLFGINNGSIIAVGLQNINMIIQATEDDYTGITTVDNIIFGSHAGGLVGLNQGDGVISYSYATGLVNASMDSIGGLIGLNQGEISYSYSTATVQGAGDTGGLVGTNEGGALLSSYATGVVNGSHGITNREGTAGGLAGSISGEGAIISTSYATGMVTTARFNGGMFNNVSLGGIVAERDDDIEGRVNVTIESSYWDNDTIWDSDAQSLPNGVGKDREHANNTGDQTGTTPLATAQLQGCELDAIALPDASPTPDCTGLFPSADWGNTTDSTAGTFDIERGWIFNADEYPSLSAVRSSDDKQLFPSAADQECHRNSMSSGC